MLRWDSRTRAPLLSVCHRAPGLPKCPGVQEDLQLQSSHNTQLPAAAAAVTVSAQPRSWPSLAATSPQQRWFLEDAFAPKPFPGKRKHGLDRATAPRPGGLGGTWVWHKAPRPGGAARTERTWPLGRPSLLGHCCAGDPEQGQLPEPCRQRGSAQRQPGLLLPGSEKSPAADPDFGQVLT